MAAGYMITGPIKPDRSNRTFVLPGCIATTIYADQEYILEDKDF